MKKAFAFLSALALSSASKSEDFLSDHELSIKPLPPNPLSAPFMFYADDEQYSRHNTEQNLHYPLHNFLRKNSEKPLSPVSITSGQNESKFVENSLYELKQIMKQRVKVQNQDKVQKPKPQPEILYAHHTRLPFDWKDPRKIRKEYQHRSN